MGQNPETDAAAGANLFSGGSHSARIVDAADSAGERAGVRKSLDQWFVGEVLPLEAGLTRYLRRNWPNSDEIEDLRQEVYTRAYEAAKGRLGALKTKAFLYAIARNLIIDRVRRAKIVVIDAIADLDALNVSAEEALPDRQVTAREELRHTQTAIDQLPPRCRSVLLMRRIEQLPQKEVARRLGIKEDTVEKQLALAMRRLAAALFAKEEGPVGGERVEERETDNHVSRR